MKANNSFINLINTFDITIKLDTKASPRLFITTDNQVLIIVDFASNCVYVSQKHILDKVDIHLVDEVIQKCLRFDTFPYMDNYSDEDIKDCVFREDAVNRAVRNINTLVILSDGRILIYKKDTFYNYFVFDIEDDKILMAQIIGNYISLSQELPSNIEIYMTLESVNAYLPKISDN